MRDRISQVLFSVWVILVASGFAQNERDLKHKYKADDCMVFYDYTLLNDSTFMIGEVVGGKVRDPIFGLNIVVQQTSIGTVTKTDGDFKIFLPRKSGELRFFFGSRDFIMSYEFDPKELEEKDTTHH